MYYAVKKGRTPGIYMSWKECEQQVSGYPGAIHKKFDSTYEAEIYVYGHPLTKGGLEGFFTD